MRGPRRRERTIAAPVCERVAWDSTVLDKVFWLSSAWFALVAWLIVRAVRQRGLLPRPGPTSAPPNGAAAAVTIIVPARDEETNIGDCLRSLLAQDYPGARVNILVIDDHSTDDTATMVERASRQHPQIELLKAPALPSGWTGKSHACWIGASAAPATTEWLCFVDADVRAEPAALAAALAEAARERLDLLSLAPRQVLGSFAERLIMPCGLCLLAFCQDLRKVQGANPDAVTATGQFMLLRRRVYDMVGGHAAVRNDICEDLALARRVKQAGGRVLLFDGALLISTRMYTGWRTLWPGLAKNIVVMLGGPASTIAIAAIGAALAWAAAFIPLAAALDCAGGNECIALVPAMTASAAAIAFHVAGALYFRIPFWYGFLFPLGYTAGALMAIDSVRRRWQGRVSWKGRTYP